MIKEVTLLDLVQDDLLRVEQKMRSIAPGPMRRWPRRSLQLLASGGKRLRPALALGAYGLFGRSRVGQGDRDGRRGRDAAQRHPRA